MYFVAAATIPISTLPTTRPVQHFPVAILVFDAQLALVVPLLPVPRFPLAAPVLLVAVAALPVVVAVALAVPAPLVLVEFVRVPLVRRAVFVVRVESRVRLVVAVRPVVALAPRVPIAAAAVPVPVERQLLVPDAQHRHCGC